jgi:hypothetical protein
MKRLFCFILLGLLALSALAYAADNHAMLPLLDEENHAALPREPPSIESAVEPATDVADEADDSNYADAFLPIRPSNSDKGAAAVCSSAKSCGRCLSGDFGQCGWCGEHGDEGRCYECVMVEGKCVGPTEKCSRTWNARACPSNHHTGRHFVLSVGAIIGITVGGASACALALCACCCWICFRRRRRRHHEELGHHHHHHDHGYVLV